MTLLEHYEVTTYHGKPAFRCLKAIETQPACLRCHGEDIPAPILRKLDELYPGDQARGFQVGDIGGTFTVTTLLEE
ncbi:c-type heme family protein [Methylomarinovum caldicuralii]|uniref:c-type heme family protein n=1 Tax=Methylomarinovum caldicuralii TaxID=438856 RepID=UPI0029546A63|nr:DUF3365 domain-containing protein [Methylomarinovum caldicuralii]